MKLPQAKGFVVRTWSVVAVGILVLSVLVAVSIDASRGRHEEQEALDAWGMARVLESDVEGIFSEASLVLLTVGDAWERHLRGQLTRREVNALAQQARAAVPDVDMILLADAEGLVVAGTHAIADSPVSVADRAYFRRLRELAAPEPAVDGPLVERLTGREVVVFARRARGPDADFGGAVIAAVATERLVRTLGDAKIGPRGEVVLYGENLQVLARYPPLPGAPRDVEGEPPADLRRLRESGEQSASFQYLSPFDGVPRRVSYRRVDRFPAVLIVAYAPEDYLSHWRRDAAATLVVACILAAVAVGAGAMVHIAWRRQQAYAERLTLIARTDELTGLPNRRAFFEAAEAERARAVRYRSQMAVLMLDIDNFKLVNDTHGHRAGDLVLMHLGETFGVVLREIDVLGRVGGEEFAILLPETGLASAAEVAGRLRAAVEAASVPRPEGTPLRITISIGVACLQGDENLDTLVSRADTALYQAKRDGRNCVRVLEGSGPPWNA
jgi:diguanylate cyclase (GGDEF)-like protein